MKFKSGVNCTFVPPMMSAVPFVGLTPMMASTPPSVSTESLPSGSNVFVVFSVMLKASGLACGGIFVTVMVMSELFVPPMPSVIV